MRITYLLFVAAFFGLTHLATAQSSTPRFWREIATETVVIPASAVREFEPDAYHAFEMDYEAIRVYLTSAPREFTPDGMNKPLHLEVPQADGTTTTFAMVETPLVSDALLAKYPLIRSYTGYALNDQVKKITITVSPDWGFKGAIRRADRGIEYIEPLAKGQNALYMVYDRRAFPAQFRHPELRMDADFPVDLQQLKSDKSNRAIVEHIPGPAERGLSAGIQVKVKKYRFACAATGEFSIDHGGTTASVLAAMIDYTAKLNAFYESDLDIRLVLIDQVESILFLDPATDPYTGTSVGEWMSQNPAAMIQTIGFETYDIGHVFARYQGGNAVGVAGGICCTDFKGRGCSSSNLPYGDYFLGVIGQEIGHQWTGGHTWTHCGALGAGDAPSSACEPGSGSTIMSYAGACGGTDDVQGSADLYYNVCSIVEIRAFVETGIGNTCGSSELVPNFAPMVTIAHPNGFSIPISTPFELKGSAMDADGDALTYCWEEADLGPLVPMGQPQGSTPIFRTYPPVTGTSRTFPRIQTIVANSTDKKELLPTYTRDLTFCLTARDNKFGGGGVGIDTVEFKAVAAAGPFRISYPNIAGVTWHPNEYQYVTWSVANTDVAPVNCKVVNVRLSKDGGLTYPITLASNVQNTGSACVLVPNEIGITMRIRVEAADNVFFDISNFNFTISAATTPGFGICIATPVSQACIPGNYSTSVGNSNWAGFNEAITYSVTGLPATATATFSANPAPAGDDVTLNIDFGNTPEGPYDLKVVAAGITLSDTATMKVTVVSNEFDALSLVAPADGSVGISQSPNLEWTGVADANKYQVQVASNPSFAPGTIKLDNANVLVTTLPANANLGKGIVYYWRVRPLNECGTGPWTAPYIFSTQVDACASYTSTDLPKNISANSTTPVESKITISGGGPVSDVNVKSLKLSHDGFNQLEVKLISPSGTALTLFKNKCGFSATIMDAGFDDASSMSTFPCPPNNGQILRPQQLLSGMNGLASAGEWKLQVIDNAIGSGGSVTEFMLEVCSAASLNPPVIVTNNILNIQSGSNALVTNALLKAEDPDNTPSQLVFTIVDVPVYGFLELAGWGVLHAGDQLTQAQIDAGYLRYFDYGFATDNDHFRFAVTDGNGGLATGSFTIGALVSASDLLSVVRFSLSPNPATESVRIDFGSALRSDATIMIRDAAGRLVRTLEIKEGTSSQSVQLRNMASGMYAVTVQQAEGIATRKLMIR